MSNLVLPVLPPSPRELKLAEEKHARAGLRRLRRSVTRYRKATGARMEDLQYFKQGLIYWSVWMGLPIVAVGPPQQYPTVWISAVIIMVASVLTGIPKLSVSIADRLVACGYANSLGEKELIALENLVIIAESQSRRQLSIPAADDVLYGPCSPLHSPLNFMRRLRDLNGVKRKERRRR